MTAESAGSGTVTVLAGAGDGSRGAGEGLGAAVDGPAAVAEATAALASDGPASPALPRRCTELLRVDAWRGRLCARVLAPSGSVAAALLLRLAGFWPRWLLRVSIACTRSRQRAVTHLLSDGSIQRRAEGVAMTNRATGDILRAN